MLTGSIIAIAILILLLGIPGFPEDVEDDLVAVDTSSQPEPEPLTGPVPEPMPEPMPEATPAPEMQPGPAEPRPADEPEAQPAEVAVVAATKQHWYAFWSPFRSELAANGFVSELQRTTGLDYRVVKVKPGVYEVAFAYSDDEDVAEKLARIADASGLDIAGTE